MLATGLQSSARYLELSDTPTDASFSFTRWQHFVAWNDVMTASDIKSKIPQLMRIYLRNIPAKFHPDPIWNVDGVTGALGFFEDSRDE